MDCFYRVMAMENCTLEETQNTSVLTDEDLGRQLAIELVDASVSLNERYEAAGRLARRLLMEQGLERGDLIFPYLFDAAENKVRVEKAEAELENVRSHIEAHLRLPITSPEEQGWANALRMIADAAGFEIIPYVPAQPLRVEIRK